MRFDNEPVQLMEKSLDVAWLRMRVHANNLANTETPGYKARSVSFEEVYHKECKSPLHGGTHKDDNRTKYRATVWTDDITEARVDGNNVSEEKEQTDLWRAQAQYAYLVQKVNGHYTTIRNVISQMSK